MRKFRRLFEDIPAKNIVVNIVANTLWTVLNCGVATVMSKLTGELTNDARKLIPTIMFFTAYIIVWELVEYCGDFLGEINATHIENNGYESCFEKLYTTKPEILKKANTGYVAGLLNKTIMKKERAFKELAVSGCIGIMYIIYNIVYFAKFSWTFSLILFLISIINISIRVFAIKITKKRLDALNEIEALRTKIFMDATTNISTVQKLRGKEFIKEKMAEVSEEAMKRLKKFVALDEFFFCLYKISAYMLLPICLIAIVLMKQPYPFNLVECVAYIAMVNIQFVHIVKGIGRAVREYGVWSISQDKMDNITVNQSDSYTDTSLAGNFSTIEIRDTVYQYLDDKNKKSVTVRIPDFKVNKGDFICISGESGQGKTTTLNLLSGTIENDNVWVDGEKCKKNIGAVYIAQDVEMFDMSLRDNLSLGQDVKDEEIIELLNEVGLKDWFDSQVKGLDTILGERGVFVSTGQRQRLNLIRGLLIKDREIYLLDEPTSNVDDETEIKMVELIKEKLKGKTVVIVTHRDKIKKICNKQYIFKNRCMSGVE